MPELPALRASDADRARTVVQLRENAVDGRLTLEGFTERVSSAYTAQTRIELEELLARSSRGLALRRVTCLCMFGNIDLDLHQATLESTQDVARGHWRHRRRQAPRART